MPRPPSNHLTERELEVMQVFWDRSILPAKQRAVTAAAARDQLASTGRDLTYTTVANLCRVLMDKGYLKRCNNERPFLFVAARSFSEVSGVLVGDLVNRLFRGSSERLLMHFFGDRPLTSQERDVLKSLLESESDFEAGPSDESNGEEE